MAEVSILSVDEFELIKNKVREGAKAELAAIANTVGKYERWVQGYTERVSAWNAAHPDGDPYSVYGHAGMFSLFVGQGSRAFDRELNLRVNKGSVEEEKAWEALWEEPKFTPTELRLDLVTQHINFLKKSKQILQGENIELSHHSFLSEEKDTQLELAISRPTCPAETKIVFELIIEARKTGREAASQRILPLTNLNVGGDDPVHRENMLQADREHRGLTGWSQS